MGNSFLEELDELFFALMFESPNSVWRQFLGYTVLFRAQTIITRYFNKASLELGTMPQVKCQIQVLRALSKKSGEVAFLASASELPVQESWHDALMKRLLK